MTDEPQMTWRTTPDGEWQPAFTPEGSLTEEFRASLREYFEQEFALMEQEAQDQS